MRVIEFLVDQLGNKEVLINGRPHEHKEAQAKVWEPVFRHFTLEQQWYILCELKKLLNQLNSAYEETRVNAGELTYKQLEELRAKARLVPGIKAPAFMTREQSPRIFVPEDFKKKSVSKARKPKKAVKKKK